MFVQIRKITVQEGNAHHIIERFGKPGVVEKQPGYIDTSVMVKKKRSGPEEVVVIIRWESEQHWKQWEKSDEHLTRHKANRAKPRPEYIIDTQVELYEVKTIKEAVVANE